MFFLTTVSRGWRGGVRGGQPDGGGDLVRWPDGSTHTITLHLCPPLTTSLIKHHQSKSIALLRLSLGVTIVWQQSPPRRKHLTFDDVGADTWATWGICEADLFSLKVQKLLILLFNSTSLSALCCIIKPARFSNEVMQVLHSHLWSYAWSIETVICVCALFCYSYNLFADCLLLGKPSVHPADYSYVYQTKQKWVGVELNGSGWYQDIFTTPSIIFVRLCTKKISRFSLLLLSLLLLSLLVLSLPFQCIELPPFIFCTSCQARYKLSSLLLRA